MRLAVAAMEVMMGKIRWNLWFFYIGLMLAMGAVMYFALRLIVPGVVEGNEELIIGGVMALVGAAVGYVGGYANGSLSALTAPDGGPAMIPVDSAVELAKLASGRDN